jgi:hypothetical protein
MFRAVSLLGGLIYLCPVGPAQAQWLQPWSCATCAPPPCVQCAQPICETVPVYQTVPVTEMREIEQTVMRPVQETEYIDQPYTEYRPVTEQRTASIPTVTYNDVTEMQTVTRDMGCWQTRQQCNPKIAPCMYDNRRGFLGWMNRTGFAIRQSFTPAVTTKREYIPNVVAMQVPVTRRVAQYGTREVAYNVTTMVAHHATRKVAINKVRMVAEKQVLKRPVTVYRTIPVGTRTAMTYAPYGSSSRTALAPTPDPVSAQGAPPIRSADSSNGGFGDPARQGFKRQSSDPGQGSIQQDPPSPEVSPDALSEAVGFKVPSVVRYTRVSSSRSEFDAPTLARSFQ